MKYLKLVLLIALISCENIEIRHNQAEDINEATEFTEKFYSIINTQNFESASKLFEGEMSPSQGLSVLIKLNSLVGNLVKAELSKVETTVNTSRKGTEKTYIIEADIKYEKDQCHETLKIRSYNGELKISAYSSTVGIV
jgi:hypothetical protein